MDELSAAGVDTRMGDAAGTEENQIAHLQCGLFHGGSHFVLLDGRTVRGQTQLLEHIVNKNPEQSKPLGEAPPAR